MTVRALLSLPPRPGPLLGDDGYAQTNWPRLVQLIDTPKFATVLGKAVAPAVLLLSPEEPNGFRREWQAFSGITPDRHRGYALQWFSLALALVVIYLVLNVRRTGTSGGTSQNSNT